MENVLKSHKHEEEQETSKSVRVIADTVIILYPDYPGFLDGNLVEIEIMVNLVISFFWLCQDGEEF